MRLRSSETPLGHVPVGTPGTLREGHPPIGHLLNIEKTTGDAVADRQAQTGRLFGETAVELGVASEAEVQRAIETQQGFSVLPAGDDRIDPLVVAAFNPQDPLARAARDLRGTITSAKRNDGAAVRSVALLGVDATAETALLAANLSVACAQAGYRTLLLDAALDHPQQHGLFRLSNRAGLSGMLSSNDHGDRLAQPSALANLAVMTAGPAVPNVPELLDRQAFSRALDTLSGTYGLMIVDAANAGANGLAISEGLDAAVLVVRRDVSASRTVAEAVTHLQATGTAVLGIVLAE